MAKRITFVLVSVLAVYLVFAFNRGLDLFRVGGWQLVTLGVCVMALPILGTWLVIREVRFGFRSSEMGKLVALERLPSSELKPRTEAAQRYLEHAIELAKVDQDDWQNWFCVAIGYDLAGNRKLARESMQFAVELYSKR